MAGYGWGLWVRLGRDMKVMGWGWLGVGLGLGLAAFYWLPLVMELPLVQSEWLSYGAYDFRVHFVNVWQLIKPYWGYGISQVGTDDGLPFFLGGWQILMIYQGLRHCLFRTHILQNFTEVWECW